MGVTNAELGYLGRYGGDVFLWAYGLAFGGFWD
jgi:hypothetical protein